MNSAPAFRTRLSKMLDCRHPILLPGMSWISSPELVAAVSNSGGCGILATGPLSPDETRTAIRKIRKLTNDSKPFGIGATLLMPGAVQNAKVAIEEQVPLLNVSLGKADWISEAVHSYGGHVLATVTNAKHAEAALGAGADALMCTGHEAAAHGGDITNLVLIPSLSRQFPDVPLVAAGGFASGQGLAAALTLGADGVAMGTRFAVSKESPLAQATKEAVVRSGEADTIYGSNFDGIPARVLKTPGAAKVMNSRPSMPVVIYRAFQAARQMKIPLWKVLPGIVSQWEKMFVIAQFGAATQAIKAATIEGELDHGVQFIGQCQGLIDSIESVDDIMLKVMDDAEQALEQSFELMNDSRDARKEVVA